MPWGRPRRTQHGESVMSETDRTRGVNLASIEAFADMLAVPRWLVWSWVKRGARWTKVPHIPGTIIHARVNDPRGVSYAEARAAVTAVSQPAAGVGWRVLDDIGRVWIDADKCRDPNTGAIAPWAAVLLAWAARVGAYHEITPSGTGIRIMGRVEGVEGAAAVPFQTHMMMAPFLKELDEGALEDWGGSADCHPRAGIELYHACARYVTVTGHEGEGRADADLTELVMPLVEMAREAGGGGGLREGRAAGRAPAGALRGPIEDVTAALEVMKNDAVSWDAWVKVGLAVVNASGAERWDEGLAAFDLWSMKCAEKYDAEATAAHFEHWIRSPADQLGIGWLMKLAAEADPAWRRPSRRAEAEFDVVDLPPGSSEAPVTPAGGERRKKTAARVIAEAEAADAFVAAHKDRLRFDHTSGKWFLWDGARWKREETKLAFHWASVLARRLASSLGGGGAQAGKASFASGVERLAQADRAFAVTHEVWDADPWLLGTPGGVVDLRTGESRPARPGDYITRLTAVAPAATAGACPLWLKFLGEATGGDADMIAFLQRWFGYCLTGVIDEHALVFVYGDGGNGKGVMMNTLFRVMGDYAANAVMDTFVVTRGDRHSTDLAMLAGARLVMATEVEEGQTWAEARIKTLTGGDPITARFMRQDNFTFMPRFKLTISGNHKPALRGVDNSTRRRFNMVPFTRRPAVPDISLANKLAPEWPGILRWAIDGCVAWRRDGLAPPDAVSAATADYFEAQDHFGRWLEERCVFGVVELEKPAALWRDFQAWCRENGEDASNNRRFRGMLEKTKGIRYAKSDGLLGVRGVRLKAVEEMENGGTQPF